MVDDRFERGMAIRRATLGKTYVEQARQKTTEFDQDFQTYITESAWGSIWSRGHLSPRERSMITIAMLASLGHHDELALHLKATRNTGTSLEDVREVLMQVAVYAGVPAANTAFQIAREILLAPATDRPSPSNTD